MRYPYRILFWALLITPAQARDWSPAEVSAQALKASHVLHDYQARRHQAHFDKDEAEAAKKPTLNFTGGYNYLTPTNSFQAGPEAVATSTANNYSLGLSLRQLIYSFGQVESSVAALLLAEKVSHLQYLDQESRVVEDSLVQFQETVMAEELLGVAVETLKARESAYKDAQVQYDAGVVSQYDVLRSKTLVAQARQQKIEAERDVRTTRHKLFLTLGTPESAEESLVRKMENPPPPPAQLAPFTNASTLQQRPDVQAATTAAEEARARVEVSEHGDAPRLDLQSDYLRRNSTAVQAAQQWTVGVQLSVPLFDGGFARIRSDRARALADQYEAVQLQTRRQAEIEIATLFEDLQAKYSDIDSTQAALESAREAARVSRLRYQNGLNTNVELLDAEASLSDAAGRLVRARRDYAIALIHWNRAIAARGEINSAENH